jgi:Holliday junction resolvase RusA-like endonuclease
LFNYRYTIDEIPPSLNKYLGNSHNYKIYGTEKERWCWLMLIAIGDRTPLKPLQKVEINFKYYFKNNVNRDLDNIAGKFCLDPLVKFKVLKDDNFHVIPKITIEGAVDKANPHTEINIIVLEE